MQYSILDKETQLNITKFYPKSRLCHFSFHSNNHSTILLIKRDKDQKSLLNHPIIVIPLIKEAQRHSREYSFLRMYKKRSPAENTLYPYFLEEKTREGRAPKTAFGSPSPTQQEADKPEVVSLVSKLLSHKTKWKTWWSLWPP